MRFAPLTLVLAAACASTVRAPASSTATPSASTAYDAAASGVVVVANQQSASATIVDVATRRATTVAVGSGPHEAAVSPDARWAVVTIYGTQQPGNQLAVLDLATHTVARTIDLGDLRRPHGAAFVGGSSRVVAITSEVAQRVALVDIADGLVLATVPTSGAGSHMLGVTADGLRAFTANIATGSVSELDLRTRRFVRQLPVSTRTEGIGVSPDGAEVWLGSNDKGTVSIVDTRSWTVAKTLTGFAFPYRIGFSPDGRWAVICDPQGNRIHVADVGARAIVGTIDGLPSPRGVRIAGDNRTAYVTTGDDDAVVAVDLRDRAVKFRVAVEKSPDGVGYGHP